MDAFFKAQSVAVVGVSDSPNNLGRAMVYNLMEFRYQGLIYLVGPKGGVFLGHKIYRSPKDLPEPVELATILVPARAVPEVLRQCGEKGIRRVVVQSAGFRELGDDRLALEEEIKGILGHFQMRMIGPNCIGIINRENGLAVPFMPMKAEAPLGRIAVISQSGGVGAMMLNGLAAQHMGFSKFMSIGNKLDVNEIDLLQYLIQDDNQTDVIFCYLEGLADGRKLMQLAARSQKPIIIHKSNRGKAGAVIARSHSASLSTDDQVVEAAFEQSGIIRVYEQSEALQVLKACMLPSMQGDRLAIISRSGGHAVMAADAADEFGFDLPPFPEDVVTLVKERSRAGVIRLNNPLDLGDLFDLNLYRMLVEQTLAREDIDGLLFIHNYQGIFDAEQSRQLIRDLEPIVQRNKKPLAVCIFTPHRELELNRRAVSFPIFSDPRQALRALAENKLMQTRQIIPLAAERPADIVVQRAKEILAGLPDGPIPAGALAEILTSYGIVPVTWGIATSAEQALGIARQIGFPVAVKTAEPSVVHKSDAGGVRLDLSHEQDLLDVYREMSRFGPSVMIQKMVPSRLEWLVGGRQDEQFGPVVVSGLGGIYVEVLRETEIRIGPLDLREADRMIEDCKGSALLAGVRGRPALDRKALADTLVRVSWLLADCPEISELDLNPVSVHASGCCALDWRATKRNGS